MFISSLLPLLIVSSAWGAPQQTNPTGCDSTVQSGNLSPNGVSGNFGLFNGVLAFDPTNLVTGFGISLQGCSSGSAISGATATGTLLAPTGECLAGQNATTTQGPTVVAIDCATTSARSDTTWALSNGKIFWTGPTSSACSTGLYGYQSVSSSGAPAAVQKSPVNLGCSADDNVFGFSVL